MSFDLYNTALKKLIIFEMLWTKKYTQRNIFAKFKRPVTTHDKRGLPIKSAITLGKYEEFLFINPSINLSFDFSITSVTGYELCNITYILPFKKLKTKSIFFKKNFLWTSSATHYPEISVGSVVSPKNWIAPPL